MLLYEDARRRAAHIRETFPLELSGVRGLVELAGTLGATVEFRPLEPTISGVVVKYDRMDPVIYINSDEPEVRQRFTLAHEIGHLVERQNLAEDEEYSFIDHRSATHYDLHEFYADEFAGSLLMPAREFLQIRAQRGDLATAIHFGVSVPAVKKRAERLAKTPENE